MKKIALKKIKVSIVIPCFNEKNNIKEIIEAVIDSPVPNKEIIIVDDCSTDGKIKLYITKIILAKVLHCVLELVMLPEI